MLDSNSERLGIKESAALWALASDRTQARFHISSEQLPFQQRPLGSQALQLPQVLS